jgi:hypothetical protein
MHDSLGAQADKITAQLGIDVRATLAKAAGFRTRVSRVAAAGGCAHQLGYPIRDTSQVGF